GGLSHAAGGRGRGGGGRPAPGATGGGCAAGGGRRGWRGVVGRGGFTTLERWTLGTGRGPPPPGTGGRGPPPPGTDPPAAGGGAPAGAGEGDGGGAAGGDEPVAGRQECQGADHPPSLRDRSMAAAIRSTSWPRARPKNRRSAARCAWAASAISAACSLPRCAW